MIYEERIFNVNSEQIMTLNFLGSEHFLRKRFSSKKKKQMLLKLVTTKLPKSLKSVQKLSTDSLASNSRN